MSRGVSYSVSIGEPEVRTPNRQPRGKSPMKKSAADVGRGVPIALGQLCKFSVGGGPRN